MEDRGLDTITAAAKNLASQAKLKLTSNNQQAVDKLFRKLKIGTVKSNVFGSPEFQQWSTSVAKTYKKN
ncbi:unnamed protein product [Phytophthora lilii]|uniref:Unnamed protein product n=1 Tax=Phytophthora lilii TaxID=2077276 RepID=A0A9W6X5T7_9STRA|nr:unnamed protein product [Phytophthora lilii]